MHAKLTNFKTVSAYFSWVALSNGMNEWGIHQSAIALKAPA